MYYDPMSANVSDQSSDFSVNWQATVESWKPQHKKSALGSVDPCGTKETNPEVLEVVVQDTMKMKDKDGNGVLNAKEFWEFGEEDGSLHQL